MTLPLSITTQSGEPILFSEGLPHTFPGYNILEGASSWHVEIEKFGLLLYQQINLYGCTAWINQFFISKPVEFHVSGKIDDLLLHYTIKGKMQYVIDNEEKDTDESQLNFMIPQSLYNIMRFKEPGIYMAISVQVHHPLLQEYKDSFPIVQILLDKITTGKTVSLRQRVVANERLRNIVSDITDRQLPKTVGKKYSEQKINEFIIESLDMLSRYLKDEHGLTVLDHKRGNKTEIYLLNHLRHPTPPTLKQLAKYAGTNEKKLEEIFRCRHGTTVYDYFQNARMDLVYRKLTETDIPLQDISVLFGYTDYSSFSYAVKRRFSFGPKELRNKNFI
ncbi:AraC-type DNA-binding protein [Chitinophaga sp. YR573]|uniref:helix-turn-helix domain-containing protein n=1 Tax=Chitinophaga sp. YR573 TaxID=1881040 RepID=UPI0008B381B7|nr:AraC family transcriptional regulator [Chitinophaga sp. YR573]SEW03603.1 AraC-type DNA-binding protein [Chitinophaga sp. YR573]